MSRKPPFTQRRILLKQEVAFYLGRCVSWFDDNLERLHASGFPRRNDILGGYDRVAIDHWLDSLGGLDRMGRAVPDAGDYDDAWTRAAGG